MGLPHSPVFANIFLAFHEEQWLTNCPAHFKPVLYRRYVDDTFVLFSDKSHAPLFLNYLNRQHNINFTIKTENDRSLSFIDVSVCRNADGFSTSVFRKPTFSGLGIRFFSFCSKNFKSNCIMTLLHRAYNVCSSYSNLNNELTFVTTFFKNNGFPLHLIKNKIKFFLEAKYNTPVNINDDEIRNFYFSMPYFGSQSEKMRIELCNLLKQYFPSIKFNVILVNHHTIGSLLKHKDTLNKVCARQLLIYISAPSVGLSM